MHQTNGIVINVPNLAMLDMLDAFVPGTSSLFLFELLIAIAVVVVSIWAIMKASDPMCGSAIKLWGTLIMAAGLVYMIWTNTLLGAVSETASVALGSLIALGVIGGLLVFGGAALEKRARTANWQ